MHEAWRKVRDLADAATDGLDAWGMLEAEAQRLTRARQAEHRAFLAGEGPKPKGAYKPMDTAARRADQLLACSARVDLVLSARSAYDALLADRTVTEETRATLITEFTRLQDTARQAVELASSAFYKWLRVRDALCQVTADLGLAGGPTGEVPSMGNELHRWFSEAEAAWPALERLLGSNDPIGSGRWAAMTREELEAEPPLWARERLAQNHPGSADRTQLRRIEMKERATGRLVSALEVPAGQTQSA